ncbi:hypothetical protein [Sinanaerobacter chloroacetimidivorans]|uniref:Uncharacterized protein n=1 Tax=Sinanaerobacter chloroacetimidivorans TaxID=2818044 RepID=A0A8J8B492_9FIRM|nr:hypothetical protein [Sinanaerobacter chloroacetimidivorans]MBR0600487.1 hypothetical protein [Sinanaerobacter chloroacetimidivorans]
MRGDIKKSDVVPDTYKAYEMGLEADEESKKVTLKNDGNVTRQILDAIGFETLQSDSAKKKEQDPD